MRYCPVGIQKHINLHFKLYLVLVHKVPLVLLIRSFIIVIITLMRVKCFFYGESQHNFNKFTIRTWVEN